MTRIRQIIEDARYSLADPLKERWSDERLIRLLSRGQKDIARETKLLKGEVELVLLPDKAVYQLPEDLWLIKRAAFGKVVLPLNSYDAMDCMDPAWFSRKGPKVECLIYDIRNIHEIRVWPTPNDEIDYTTYKFENEGVAKGTLDSLYGVFADAPVDKVNGVLAGMDDLAQFNSVYGVTAGLLRGTLAIVEAGPYMGVVNSIDDVLAEPLFGVVTEITADDEYTLIDPLLGVTTDLQDMTGAVTIQYIKDPDDVTSLDAELVLPRMFDAALLHFVIGHAFADDIDTQYQQKSAMHLQMYARELTNVGTQTKQYDAAATTQYNRSSYRSAFDD